MKRYGLYFLAVALVCGYAFFGVYQAEIEQEKTEEKKSYLIKNRDIKKIEVFTASENLSLELDNNLWWMRVPRQYLANQERVAKALFAMVDTPFFESFPYEADNYGFSPGKATIHLVFDDLEWLRLVVGKTPGPNNSLYLLNADTKMVYVVHNVWGQILHSTVKDFYHPYLPIPGVQIKGVHFAEGETIHWSVAPHDAKTVDVELREKPYHVDKAKMLWFFKQLKEFKLTNHQWGVESTPKGFNGRLDVAFDKGNIMFHFNDQHKKVWIPRFSVIADYNSYALGVLTTELEKAVENGKK